MGKYNNLKDLLSTLWKNERKIYCCKYAKNTKLKKPKLSYTWYKHIYSGFCNKRCKKNDKTFREEKYSKIP